MEKGIIYVMTTAVPGLIKIGKTASNSFEQRMYALESNGYKNVAALKREFAIEVENYDEKESLIHSIFSKSQVGNTELFSLDKALVIQLLSAFEGAQVYPKNQTKEEIFEETSDQRGVLQIPDGIYSMSRKIKAWEGRTVSAKVKVENGRFTILPGAIMSPVFAKGNPATLKLITEKRQAASIENDILQTEISVDTPSLAASIVINGPANGWMTWKTSDGQPIDVYRK